MSGLLSTSTSAEPTRRRLSARQAETVQRLSEAAVEALRDEAYDELTVRNVARRAGVAPATAYTYFASKEHLVTEVFWRWFERLLAENEPGEDSTTGTSAGRVGDFLEELALLVAGEPQVAAACTTAMLAPDPEVKLLRDRIGGAIHNRLAAALGPGADPAVLRTLDLIVTGALVQAGMGHVAYEDLPDQLRQIAALVVNESPEGED